MFSSVLNVAAKEFTATESDILPMVQQFSVLNALTLIVNTALARKTLAYIMSRIIKNSAK